MPFRSSRFIPLSLALILAWTASFALADARSHTRGAGAARADRNRPRPKRPISPDPPSTDRGNLLFNGTALSKFSQIQDAAPDRMTQVRDPLGSGSRVFKVTVRDSDVYPLTPTMNPRAQAVSRGFIRPGMEFWLRHSVMFPRRFPSTVPGWLGLMSVYGPPFRGSSPVAMMVRNRSLVLARGENYGYDNPWTMPLVKNRWINIMIHERFGADGWVDLYINGRRVRFVGHRWRLHMRTVDSANDGGPNHAKFSVYMQRGMFKSVTMYHSALRVGRTRASVGG
jgi:hypothetical protein